MNRLFLFLLTFLPFTFGCTPCCYRYPVEEASEFVLDSYKIKEGKFSILEMEGCCFPCLPPEYLIEYEDRIDEDDVLKIALYHPTRTDLVTTVNTIGSTIGYRVVNGTICLPAIEPVVVKGLTLCEARRLIEEKYSKEILHTEIFIEYALRLHSKVDLTGAVKTAEIPINGRIRLYEVLSKAEIGLGANLFKSYVVREGKLLPVDLYKLLREGDMSQNIVMRPNDKIYIAPPEAANVTVMGEVGLPSLIPIPNGSISLREALTIAGGIPYTGDKRSIQVIRGNILCPKIYKLSWHHITYLPNDSLLLMPGDTVYVSEKPITQWNRFIEQLLPSGLLLDLGITAKRVFY